MRSRFPPYTYLTRILAQDCDILPLYFKLWSNPSEKLYFPLNEIWYQFDLLNIQFEEDLEMLAELGLLDWEINDEDEGYEIVLEEPLPPGTGKALS